MDDARQEVVQDDILIVEPHQLLNLGERPTRVVLQRPIVKPQEQTMQLRYDAVFVVPRISYQGSRRRRNVPRQVLGPGISAGEGSSKEESVVSIIQVGLVVRATSVDAVQVEGGGAKVDQRVRVVLFLQAARW